MVLSVRPAVTMPIGQLTARVTLLSRTLAPAGGAAGTGLTETLPEVATVWGRLTALRGGRYVAGRQTEEVATHELVIRDRDDRGAWNHVRHGAALYRVISCQKADPGFMVVLVEELVA